MREIKPWAGNFTQDVQYPNVEASWMWEAAEVDLPGFAYGCFSRWVKDMSRVAKRCLDPVRMFLEPPTCLELDTAFKLADDQVAITRGGVHYSPNIDVHRPEDIAKKPPPVNRRGAVWDHYLRVPHTHANTVAANAAMRECETSFKREVVQRTGVDIAVEDVISCDSCGVDTVANSKRPPEVLGLSTPAQISQMKVVADACDKEISRIGKLPAEEVVNKEMPRKRSSTIPAVEKASSPSTAENTPVVVKQGRDEISPIARKAHFDAPKAVVVDTSSARESPKNGGGKKPPKQRWVKSQGKSPSGGGKKK